MEWDSHENLSRLFQTLATTAADGHGRPDADARHGDPRDTDWVIERIQDSFDSRAR